MLATNNFDHPWLGRMDWGEEPPDGDQTSGMQNSGFRSTFDLPFLDGNLDPLTCSNDMAPAQGSVSMGSAMDLDMSFMEDPGSMSFNTPEGTLHSDFSLDFTTGSFQLLSAISSPWNHYSTLFHESSEPLFPLQALSPTIQHASTSSLVSIPSLTDLDSVVPGSSLFTVGSTYRIRGTPGNLGGYGAFDRTWLPGSADSEAMEFPLPAAVPDETSVAALQDNHRNPTNGGHCHSELDNITTQDFVCQICGNEYKDKKGYERHICLEHKDFALEQGCDPDKYYTNCPDCGRYSRKDNLKRHRETMHKYLAGLTT